MGAITARPGWVAVVILSLITFVLPAVAFAEQLYIGVAPNNFVTGNAASPGTLILANDSNGSGVIVGDAFPSEKLTGYGGLAFDSSGSLWATVGRDDAGDFGSEDGTLSSTLVRINPTDGSVEQTIGQIKDISNITVGIRDLAIQPGTNTIFGVNTTTNIGQQPCDVCIFTIDKTTGIATSLGKPMQGASAIDLDTLAFAPDGTLYGTGTIRGDRTSTFRLYSIDPLTGDVIGTPEVIVRDPNDPFPTTNTTNTFGLGVRSDGTIFGTLCCSNQIVYRDNLTHLWRFLGSTGVSSDTYADLAFAPEAIPTPVPATVWLFGSGLAALLGLRRRRG